MNLKPCPFCGSPGAIEDHRLQWVVRCTSCSACVLGERAPEPEDDLPDAFWSQIRQTAVDAWNRRAALAQPELQGPTDEELDELWAEIDGGGAIWAWQHFAHAVLARWGRPAIQPEPVAPTDEEIMELMPQQMRDDLAAASRAMTLIGFDYPKAAAACRIMLNRHVVDHARSILARWGTPANNTSGTHYSARGVLSSRDAFKFFHELFPY